MSTRKWGSGRGLRMLIAGLLTSLLGLQSAQAADLLVSDGGFGGLLAIDEHSVRVTVNNGIATTEVTRATATNSSSPGTRPITCRPAWRPSAAI